MRAAEVRQRQFKIMEADRNARLADKAGKAMRVMGKDRSVMVLSGVAVPMLQQFLRIAPIPSMGLSGWWR